LGSKINRSPTRRAELFAFKSQKGMSSPGIRDASSAFCDGVRFAGGLEVGGATARSTCGFAVAVSTACSAGRSM
jgi:hypothetical protein